MPDNDRCPRCGRLYCDCVLDEEIVEVLDNAPVHDDVTFRPTYAALVGELARCRAALAIVTQRARAAEMDGNNGLASYRDLIGHLVGIKLLASAARHHMC